MLFNFCIEFVIIIYLRLLQLDWEYTGARNRQRLKYGSFAFTPWFPLLFESSQGTKKPSVAGHCCPGCLVVWPPFFQHYWFAFQDNYISTPIKSKSLPLPEDPKAHTVQITKMNLKYSVPAFYPEGWVEAHACIKDFWMKKLKFRELFLEGESHWRHLLRQV